ERLEQPVDGRARQIEPAGDVAGADSARPVDLVENVQTALEGAHALRPSRAVIARRPLSGHFQSPSCRRPPWRYRAPRQRPALSVGSLMQDVPAKTTISGPPGLRATRFAGETREACMEITALGYVGIQSSRLDDWAQLATGLLGMQQVDRGGALRAFRMDD